MFSQRNMGAPSNEFTWLTLLNPFWRVRFCLSFLGNVACCRIFWFFYKVFSVWFGFVTVQQFFMLNTLRHFRPKVPSPLLHASRFRMWELPGRPPLIYCHSRQRQPETCRGAGEGNPQPGWEAGDTSHGLWSGPGERGCCGQREDAEACWLLIKPWVCGSYVPFPHSWFQINDLRANSYIPQTSHFLFLGGRQWRGLRGRSTHLFRKLGSHSSLRRRLAFVWEFHSFPTWCKHTTGH